jgi:hypothetical protein
MMLDPSRGTRTEEKRPNLLIRLMTVHTCAFNLAMEGDSEVMGQDGLPSTRARGPVRGRDYNHQVFSSPRLLLTAWLSFGL